MGVQKSRKSIKFTKFSILKKYKMTKNNYTDKKQLIRVYDKDFFKKTRVFSLKKAETNVSTFF